MPNYPYLHMMMAATCAELGRREAAETALRALLTIVPPFAEFAYAANQRWLPDTDLVERIVEGLRRAGLPVPRPA